jgi:hypothetical protein
MPPKKNRNQSLNTPIREALRRESALQSSVKDGLNAVKTSHRLYFDESVRASFADSLDSDESLRDGREQEHRWDYLLGHTPTKKVIGVEPHSAENSEVSVVISKLEAARRQLRDHLRDGVVISKWIWVASGQVQFAPMERATFRLTQAGIKFVGRKILPRDVT